MSFSVTNANIYSGPSNEVNRSTATTSNSKENNKLTQQLAKTGEDIHSVAVSLSSIAKKYSEKD